MEHRIKILINTPKLNKSGGVANHFMGLKNKFDLNVKYNFIAGKSHSKFFVLNQIKDYFKFIILLFKFKPDLVHLNPSLDKKATFRDGVFLIISWVMQKRILIFWHGWDKNFENSIEKNYICLFKFIFNKSDAHIVLANEFKNKLEKWGINKPIYLETTKVDDDLLKNFNIETKQFDKIKILFLARIEKEKGILETVKAFEKLLQTNNKIYLIIAGNGNYLKDIKDYIKKNKTTNVSCVGYVRNRKKTEILTISNLYIFPTYYGEGMPTSVLEAMAFGLPIITRPVGGLKDFFENEKMGFITESKDTKVFAELIEKLINNKKKMREISLYNHKYAKEHFLASKVAKRLEKIYVETING